MFDWVILAEPVKNYTGKSIWYQRTAICFAYCGCMQQQNKYEILPVFLNFV